MEKSIPHSHCDDERLAKFKLFAELSREELQTLIEQSGVTEFQPGATIIRNGESGYCMYVILKGSVKVSTESEGKAIDLATLEPGDFFGEVALVDDGPRSADVTALEACKLLCITRTTLGVLAALQPAAAIHLLASIGKCLVARWREGQQKYMDLLLLGRQIS